MTHDRFEEWLLIQRGSSLRLVATSQSGEDTHSLRAFSLGLPPTKLQEIGEKGGTLTFGTAGFSNEGPNLIVFATIGPYLLQWKVTALVARDPHPCEVTLLVDELEALFMAQQLFDGRIPRD